MPTPRALQGFTDFLRERVGAEWVIAPRLTPRLKHRGYAVALTSERYRELEAEWETRTYGAPLKSLHDTAPALYAALRALVDDCDRCDMRFMGTTAARAALAKADGRPGMTKTQAKHLRLKAAKARRTQEPPTQQDREFVDYYTHSAQRLGLGYAAQRGPGFWAEEVERVVAAYQKGLTPLETEAERGPS